MSYNFPQRVLFACIMVATAFAPMANGQPTRVLKGASFRGLGDLPGGDFRSDAVAVSRNGSSVAGWGRVPGNPVGSSTHPFRWTASSGLVDLGISPNGGFGRTYDLSDDGTAVVGRWTESSGSNVPFRWTQATGAVVLSGIPAWVSSAYARTCSANGAVVAGWAGSTEDGAAHAFLWTESTGLLDLLPPAGFPNGAEAKDMSSTGNVVVGSMFTDAYLYHGFRWTLTSGMVDLGFGSGIVQDVVVEAVSGDGNVVVGSGRLASGGQVAFRWTPAGGMQSIGELAGGAEFGRAYGVSGDGNVIVGQTSDSRGNQAFVWTPHLGMRPLRDYLASVGVNLTGWTLFIAWDVSSDGRWIVGQGVNPDGNQEGFLASLPLNVVPAVAAIAIPLPRASLRGVGDLPGGDRYSLALALSPSGTHCSVDSSGTSGSGLAVYSNGNLVDCGWPAHPGTNFVHGTGITTVGGQPVLIGLLQDDLNYHHGFKWSAAGGYQVLPGLSGSSDEYAFGIDNNGQIVVGGCFVPSDGAILPCAWIDGVPVQLADLAGGGASAFANGCSSDGTVIVGAAWGTLSTNEPVIWNRATGTVASLGLIPGFGFGGASAVSGNGTSVVGRFYNDYPDRIGQAFRWSATSGMELLSTLPGYPGTYASAVSGDGTIVVGTVEDPVAGTSEACLWMPGPVRVRDLLRARGASVTGWQLYQATGVSHDGRFICGSGYNELTQSYEGWVADLGID